MDELIICEHDNRKDGCEMCKKRLQLETKRNMQNINKFRSCGDAASMSKLQIHRLNGRLGLIGV